MIVGLITELSIVGVFSRGVGNEERIVFRATEMVQMGQYGLMIGVRLGQGFASPVRDNFLWFGDAILNKGDWVFVYTGPGNARVTNLPNSQEKLYSIHWGRERTFLASPELVPVLFRVDAVQVAENVLTLPKPGA
jgi:hypothetical protein